MLVYVAGPYNGPNVVVVLANMRAGYQASIEVLKQGYAPFCPWTDYQFGLMSDGLKIDDYRRFCMEWLEVSHVCLFLSGWENSKGCVDEHNRAIELRIPIVYSIDELLAQFPLSKVQVPNGP